MFVMVSAIVLVVSLFAGCAESSDISFERSEISKMAVPTAFGNVSALVDAEIAPALVDSATTAMAATNYSEVAKFLAVEFSDSQKKFLDENKFLLIPIEETKFGFFKHYDTFDKMLAVFDEIGGSFSEYRREPQNTRLVTPDIVLHAFHKFFENSLEYLEEHELSDVLRDFTADARQQLVARKNSASGKLAKRFEVLAAQFTVAQILFENANWPDDQLEKTAINFELIPTANAGGGGDSEKKRLEAEKVADSIDTFANAEKLLANFESDFSSEILEKIRAELELIYAADSFVSSPLFTEYGGQPDDYTQFTPRSHYSKNSRLRAYFRTMMFFGRKSYSLDSDVGLSDAILLDTIFDDESIRENWAKMMEITVFFAGESDDITLAQWRNFLAEFEIADALDSEIIAAIRARLDKLSAPKILSDVIVDIAISEKTKDDLLAESKSLRTFGQRFTFDAWILNRLTVGEELTDTKLPSTPSALFVPAAFGDATAREFANQFLQKTFEFSDDEIAGFNQKLDEVVADISKVSDAEWRGSLGTAWTHLLGTLTRKFGAGYPIYMQSEFFPAKQIQTFLGSYSELKHDTVLYAKQSYTEMGGGGGGGEDELPPVPKGFVEPNLKFWHEMQRLVDYTISGFEQHKLFPRTLEEWGALNRFKKQIDFYTEFATKEFRGEQISEEDYEKLRTFNLDYLAQPFGDATTLDEDDKRVALIADIHTDVLLGQILYEATGQPFIQIVLVGNENSPRLTIGLVFNHFEFTAPLENRLTDEIWQSRVYENPAELPAKNFWYENLLVE